MAHGWLRASSRKLDLALSLPYRPYHTHDDVQKLKPGETYELEIEIWPTCIVVPEGHRIGLTVRGKDYVYPGDLSALRSRIGQPSTGVGPFRHDDPGDRPPETFANQIMLCFDDDQKNYLLLPIVNSNQSPAAASFFPASRAT